MSFISTLYTTLLDALFPISGVEKDLLSMSPTDALRILSPAPDYSGLAFDLPHARSVFAYKDERVSRLIWLIKEKRSVPAVKIAGYALFSELEDVAASLPPHESPILIIPTPISPRRRRDRGYNQCELLTDEIERLQEQAGQSLCVCEKSLLIRVDRTSEQKKKNRAERVESSHDLFDVNEETASRYDRNTCIIVIDDVITTGGTMYQALETLKKAGFANVRGMSVAH